MPDSSSTLRFWLLNALAWTLYCVAGIGMRHAYLDGGGSAGVLITAGLAVALFGCGGAIRALALRGDWWARGTAGLLLRLAVSVLLGAALVQVLVIAALRVSLAWGWVSFGTQGGDFSPMALLLYWYGTVVMLALWTALWASLHSLRRARRAELARLRAEAERSALERDALRARLNPHFMFNALNNLRALIRRASGNASADQGEDMDVGEIDPNAKGKGDNAPGENAEMKKVLDKKSKIAHETTDKEVNKFGYSRPVRNSSHMMCNEKHYGGSLVSIFKYGKNLF